MFYEVASGSYAQILVRNEEALKRPFDKINQESAYFLFREGLYLKHGFGPKFLGTAVRHEKNSQRPKFVGYFMERLEEPLSKYVPIKETHFSFFADIAESLSKLHLSGHVHCDVKPSNILVSKKCKAYLTDFGLSCYASNTGPSPCANQGPIYTPVFRAPEHLLGDTSVQSSSDIWAFGITMYVSTLMPKYPGLEHIDPKKLLDLLHAYLDPIDAKRLQALKQLCALKSIPLSFASIVSDCLIWTPSNRPSAQKVFNMLNEYKKYLIKPLELRLSRPIDIDAKSLVITRPAVLPGMSDFQKERVSLNLKNFCKLLNMEMPRVILNLSYDYCSILDYFRPSIHNAGIASLLAIYTVRESSGIQFSVVAKLLNCSLQHFSDLLEESMCFIFSY